MAYVICDAKIEAPEDVVKRIMKSRGALAATCKDLVVTVKWKNGETVTYLGKKSAGDTRFEQVLHNDILNKMTLTHVS